MSWPRALVLDVEPAARLDVQDILLLVQAAEERGDRNLQGLRQARQGGQARRRLRVLDLRQHALGQAGELGELPDGQPEVQPELADAFGDDRAERVLQCPLRDWASPLVPAVIARRQIDQLRHRSPSFPPLTSPPAESAAGSAPPRVPGRGARPGPAPGLPGRPLTGPAGPVTRSRRTNGLYRVMIQGLLSVNRELAPAPDKATLRPRVPCAQGSPVTGEAD